MANTRRETIASNRSNGRGETHLGPELLPYPPLHPVTSTPEIATRQAAETSESLIENRLFSAIGHAVDLALDSHRKTSGSTTSILQGNLIGKPLFAVSIMRWRAVELPSSPTRDQLFAFAVLNADLLLKPEYALGTWFDDARGVHVIDIVLCVDNILVALALGRHFDQQSVFDLGRSEEIAVSSTLEDRQLGSSGVAND
jgi:hypothetical protein